jgi:hypothetical protein
MQHVKERHVPKGSNLQQYLRSRTFRLCLHFHNNPPHWLYRRYTTIRKLQICNVAESEIRSLATANKTYDI